MLGLTISHLDISILTTNGTFSAKFDFQDGMNVIRAENSTGKSTTVNAIAYALGLEKILGPTGKGRVFPRVLYEEIFISLADAKSGRNAYFVKSSEVSLIIKNHNGGEATLRREVQGNQNKIAVTENDKTEDYFLGTGAGNIGSAKSSRGFHNWLTKFISWELPNVIKLDGTESQLYLECIFPLFFIEQKRGWSEIQANMPSFGIQNPKKAAIEFCLDIDNFEYDNKISKLKNKLESLENEWEQLINQAEGVADFNEVLMNEIQKLSSIDNQKIEFKYLMDGNKTSLSEKKRVLHRQLESLVKSSSKNQSLDELVLQQRRKLDKLTQQLGDNHKAIEEKLISIKDIDQKIQMIAKDYDQYQQLSKLKKVGSTNIDVDITHCPICNRELYDTLTYSSEKDAQPMTLQENIEFLKNQLDFYKMVKQKSVETLETMVRETNILQSSVDTERERMTQIRQEVNEPDAELLEELRAKINLEMEIRQLNELEEKLDFLNEQANKIQASWKLNTETLNNSKKNDKSEIRKARIKDLESELKTYLSAFEFQSSSLSSISISPQTLRPEQDGYNIVAESSASDYIRIIWSYTLSLMKLAAQQESVKHAGFVVFDEPRQHEAKLTSFVSFLKEVAKTKEFSAQVIVATSSDETELLEICDKFDVKTYCFSDHIFELEHSDTAAETR